MLQIDLVYKCNWFAFYITYTTWSTGQNITVLTKILDYFNSRQKKRPKIKQSEACKPPKYLKYSIKFLNSSKTLRLNYGAI